TRTGIHPLTPTDALALFDAALTDTRPVLIPTRINTRASDPHPLLQHLTTPTRPTATPHTTSTSPDLLHHLTQQTPTDQLQMLLGLVRTHTAHVLGHPDPATISAEASFKELGTDSLTAVELRNRLTTATGRQLPSTLVFDHPTPTALATHLRDQLLASSSPGTAGRRAPAHTATAAPASMADEPIAIVAMGCRFPGGVTSPEELWELVCQGGDAISEFPTDRGWDLDGLFHPDPDHPGTSYTRRGGFLHDAGRFDAAFFGISPREATAMDPQQRLLLEIAWETLERAGLPATALRHTNTGIYTGVAAQEYGPPHHHSTPSADGYRLTGSAASVASGRIAYTLGLEGPAVTVDTACSSSLVALHLACQALRTRECDLALAGGVTVMPTPALFTEFSRQRGLAPDGRCKPFAAHADGTGWAEGAGLVLIERLSDAQRHG
ncbi:beta-ketoacyl synthase N-terminal-like domain-containing protein, partial [Streptomyces coeruleorubidus]|uniref:acyl carrier protein n=1 Tax=Streptomyces coeruleorubidus TaxID=116188 RepID=UPI0037896131